MRREWGKVFCACPLLVRRRDRECGDSRASGNSSTNSGTTTGTNTGTTTATTTTATGRSRTPSTPKWEVKWGGAELVDWERALKRPVSGYEGGTDGAGGQSRRQKWFRLE